MKVIDVYKQYFTAECVYNGVERKGVVVTLTATSDCGEIKYEVGLSFFPHIDETDFAISYDAYGCKEIYHAKGRRSKKREAEYLLKVQEYAEELAASIGGKVFWEKPLREAVYG